MKRITPPKGFYFAIERKYYYTSVHLRYISNNVSIGNIFLSKVGNTMETHSFVSPKHRGKGYGSKLYAKAIDWALKAGYSVISYPNPSPEARRVWTGTYLKDRFKIKRNRDTKEFSAHPLIKCLHCHESNI